MISAGAPPQTPLGSLQCSQSLLAVFKGPTSKGGTGKWKEGEGKGRIREKGKEGKRRRGKGKSLHARYLQLCRSNFVSVTGAEDRIIQELP